MMRVFVLLLPRVESTKRKNCTPSQPTTSKCGFFPRRYVGASPRENIRFKDFRSCARYVGRVVEGEAISQGVTASLLDRNVGGKRGVVCV